MQIVTIPHPALKAVSQEVEQVDKKLALFVRDLEVTLKNKKNPEGVGLSAPQVAKNLRIFSLYLDHDKPQDIRSYINPEIIEMSDKLSLGGPSDKPFLEGCLSIPDVFGPVWRHEEVLLRYQVIDLASRSLETKTQKFTDFAARVVQHEMDHLDGILFTQRAVEQGLPLYKEEDGTLVKISVQ